MTFAIGALAPNFTLPDTYGNETPLRDAGTGPTVVVFTCNHCPYALAWHDRLQAVARDYGPRGVRILQINSNDATRYPHDSLEAMSARVAAGEFASPYLHDATQQVARAWEATVTPDVYVIDADGRLAYHGAPDGDHNDESLAAAWLRDALDAVLDGRAADPAETEPVGCTIKWSR
ncbi:MAG: thioredoxin family protein [Solirubrobacteraceae bacterium]|jgi:peroxiredoxin